jgi:hypothetical protein
MLTNKASRGKRECNRCGRRTFAQLPSKRGWMANSKKEKERKKEISGWKSFTDLSNEKEALWLW